MGLVLIAIQSEIKYLESRRSSSYLIFSIKLVFFLPPLVTFTLLYSTLETENRNQPNPTLVSSADTYTSVVHPTHNYNRVLQ